MSLKKHMFRSNMMILFSALLSLMVILLGVLMLFEDSFEQQWHSMEQTYLESHGVEMENADAENIGSGNTAEENGEGETGIFAASSAKNFFLTFLGALLLIGFGAIGVILFLASFFTKRMNRLIMEPVEQLVAGAKRIQEGNLDEDIRYIGEEEFEHVCQTFNAMQHTIRADKEQQAKNEKARTDMVTGISHDLRTPLTSIQGYIKGVLDGVANTKEKQEMYLKTAYESTEEMNVLLQKLFEFSRMESGQMPFHMVTADFAEYTAAYTAQKETVMEEAGLLLKFQYPKEHFSEISMDVEQVRRILDNLLENSLKYAKVQPVCVTLTMEETKEYVILHWKDNGRGVPKEKLPHIFERFYRCDEARKEKGSGIGLYVVQYIMERHQGKVTAENDDGLKINLYFPKEA